MNATEVFNRLQRQWPNLRIIGEKALGNIILSDGEYHVPYKKDAEKLINFRKWYEIWLRPYSKPDAFDCDDRSRKSMQDVREAFTGGALAYGRLGGRFLSIGPGNHMLNIMVCQDGLLLHDMEFKRLWEPTPGDIVWWGEM